MRLTTKKFIGGLVVGSLLTFTLTATAAAELYLHFNA